MWNRCDHISLYDMHEIIKNMEDCENNAGFSSAFGRDFILSGDCTGEEGCDIPLAPGEPSAEWRKMYFLLTATPFTPVKPQDIFCINKLSIPLCSYPLWTDRQADTNQITFSPLRVGAFSPPCTLPTCLPVAVREGAVRQGRPGGGKGASLWLPRGADP